MANQFMRNIKLALEYDGANYFGFQRQPGKPTIQEALQKALSKLFNRKMKIASASGRTDAGVHAIGQVVNFKTDSAMSTRTILRGLNAHLPDDVAVKTVKEVPIEFHARFQAKSKTYQYQICNSEVRSPVHAAKTLHVKYSIDIDLMRKAAKKFLGRHDFRSFSSSRGNGKDPETYVRTVKAITVTKKGSLITVKITADGFLYHMVRNIVAALIEVGKKRMPVSEISRIIKMKDRRPVPAKVPAHGLTLLEVKY